MGNFLQMSTYCIFATWLKSCTPLICIGCPRNCHPLPPYHGWEVQHHLKNHLWLKQEFLIGRGPGYSWTQVDLFNGSVLCISWQSLARFFFCVHTRTRVANRALRLYLSLSDFSILGDPSSLSCPPFIRWLREWLAFLLYWIGFMKMYNLIKYEFQRLV